MKPKPAFKWFSKPNFINIPSLGTHDPYQGEVIERLKQTKSITSLFKNIITHDMITLIAKYTNRRIALIQTDKLQNASYRKNREKLLKAEITVDELYAYIGLLILFGLANKNDIPIDMLWSENSMIHFSMFANVTMSRDRFQLISRNICFDDIDLRINRQNNKFHKMTEIFELFKQNLRLIVPSKFLCIDETLYPFRGKCSFRQFIPSKPSRYGIKYWCLIDVILGK